MSASDKKRLRKEQNAGTLTEKQIAAKKEANKTKLLTAVFVAVLALCIAVFLWTTISSAVTNSGLMSRKTIAVTANDEQINNVEFSYYYIDTVNRFYNDLQNYYGDYASMYAQLFYGLQLNQPLSSQMSADGISWADSFIEQAKSALQSNYALCNAAKAEGFQLSEDAQKTLDSQMTLIGLYATYAGAKDSTAYLKALYGNGATEESYRNYMTMTTIASEYYNAHKDSLTFTDEEIRAYEAENYNTYSSFSGNYYYVSMNTYLEGGSEDDDGKVTYSGKEKADASAKAEEVANALAAGTYASVEELDAAIAALPENAEKENVTSYAFDDVLYGSTNTIFRDWLTEEGRKEGDIAVIPVEAEDEDGNTTVSAYYVIYFRSVNENRTPLSNVRHLLVSFTGGTKDDSGNTIYSDEEKAAAKAKAEEYLAEFNAGDKTEDSFAALVSEHTDDTASKATGGLYESIGPDSKYVANFQNWAIAPERSTGDVEIVETEYGYHIMYFVGHTDITYRDQMITDDLMAQAQLDWYDAITATVTVTDKDLSRVDRDLIIARASTK